MRNIFGDQGNMERNFWEHGNSVKANFGEHLNLFLRNKETTASFHRGQGNMHPPPPLGGPQLCIISVLMFVEKVTVESNTCGVGAVTKQQHTLDLWKRM